MGFYKTASDDLKSILPDVKSFSPTNLKYMRYFYEMYPDAVICPQVEDKLNTDINRPQVGDDLQIIFRIPWGHNKIILDKCKGNSAKVLLKVKKQASWAAILLLQMKNLTAMKLLTMQMICLKGSLKDVKIEV